jgi:hypothetical protein
MVHWYVTLAVHSAMALTVSLSNFDTDWKSFEDAEAFKASEEYKSFAVGLLQIFDREKAAPLTGMVFAVLCELARSDISRSVCAFQCRSNRSF